MTATPRPGADATERAMPSDEHTRDDDRALHATLDALETLARRRADLARRDWLRWTDEDAALVLALRFNLATRADDRPELIAIVGGASSGKSTLFNNLTRTRLSAVGVRAHTTRGPLLAAPRARAEDLKHWFRSFSLLWPCDRPADADRDAATTGQHNTTTIAPIDDAAPDDPVLIDTPDFTSDAAQRSGDLTRAMLPWFDRVVVVIDEDRWFDEQVFGWLRARLDRLGAPRFVLLNRCQRAATPDERAARALRERAAQLSPHSTVIDFTPGAGCLSLPQADLQPLRQWLSQRTTTPLRPRAQTALSERARDALAAAQRRDSAFESLRRAAREQMRYALPTRRRIVREVLLTPAQRRALDPLWQATVGPVQWLADRTRDAASGLPWPLMRKRKPRADAEEHDENSSITHRGRTFFLSETSRARARLAALDHWQPFRQTGPASASNENTDSAAPAPDDPPDFEQEALRVSTACQSAYEQFAKRLESESGLTGPRASSLTGAVAGAVAGALIAAPTVVAAPIGAAVGAALGASATAAGAHSLRRAALLLVGTPELRRLRASFAEYRAALEDAAARTTETMLDSARASLLHPDDPARTALETLARHHQHTHAGEQR